MKNKILKFILLFIVLTALTHGTNYIFRPQHVDLIRSASIAFGSSFGIIFVSEFLLLKIGK